MVQRGPEGVLIGIQQDTLVKIIPCAAVRGQLPDIRAHQGVNIQFAHFRFSLFSRSVTAFPCAWSPSISARVSTTGPRACSPSGVACWMVMLFWKLSRETPLYIRA